jgi:hypothetical protein
MDPAVSMRDIVVVKTRERSAARGGGRDNAMYNIDWITEIPSQQDDL